MKSLLFILVSIIAVTSILSGLFMISRPDGSILNLPLSLLEGTSFTSFLVPGILLTLIVGGVNLLAVFFILQRQSNRYNWALAGGLVICGWIIIQIILIHTAHWLHFLYLGMGLLIILIAYQLKGKWLA